MKRRLKKLLIRTPGFLALCRLLTRRHVRTLMYHRFIGVDELGRRHVSPEDLRRHLDHIGQHHAVVSSLDHLESLKAGKGLGRCPVVITVDDGYRDFYEIAFPELARRGWPATFFAATGLVDGITWFWWDKLAYLIHNAERRRLTHRLQGRELGFDLASEAGRLRAWKDVSEVLIRLSPDDGRRILGDLSRAFRVEIPDDAPERFRGVTWEEAREMRRSGILFGGHTVTHPILARIPAEAAREEIQEGRRRLEEEMGEEPVLFCYTQGRPMDFDGGVEALVKASGFEASYVAYQEPDLSSRLTSLPRYPASPDWDEFRWNLSGAEFLRMALAGLVGRILGRAGRSSGWLSARGAPS